jgi:hypothetical protein
LMKIEEIEIEHFENESFVNENMQWSSIQFWWSFLCSFCLCLRWWSCSEWWC